MRMKKAAMRQAIEDGTVVAFGSSFGDEVPTGARQGVIVSVGAKRRVYTGARHDWNGHLSEDGVRIRPLEPLRTDEYNRPIVRGGGVTRGDVTETNTADIVVAPKDVLGAWDEYQTALAEQRDHRQTAAERKAKSERDHKDAAARLRTALGVESQYAGPQAHLYYDRRDPSATRYDGVLVPLSSALRILEVLES